MVTVVLSVVLALVLSVDRSASIQVSERGARPPREPLCRAPREFIPPATASARRG